MPTSQIQRPPVVAIMGHVDHGKSSLLDYIRKSNIVAGEAGGITQHISAYEVSVPDSEGVQKRITFIDTPGHAAFSHMRERGATIADIAILIVSAEEGVKAQTKEAIKTITGSKVPFIVAITKIDRPNSNVMKVKTELMEQEVFVEGMGGSISCVAISSKSGEGIPELLETILLLAELEDFKGNPNIPAEGFIVEANMDDKRGISATMIIKDGTLKQGNFVVVDDAWTTTRIIEDFMGKTLSEVSFSTPIRLTGFSKLPNIASYNHKIGLFYDMGNVYQERNLDTTFQRKTLQDIGLGYYSSFDDFFLRTQIAWNLNSKPISSEYTNHKNSKFLVQAGWVF